MRFFFEKNLEKASCQYTDAAHRRFNDMIMIDYDRLAKNNKVAVDSSPFALLTEGVAQRARVPSFKKLIWSNERVEEELLNMMKRLAHVALLRHGSSV